MSQVTRLSSWTRLAAASSAIHLSTGFGTLWWNVSRAPDWNPLANLANHCSGGWKKDLDFYMGAYFRLNYRHESTSKWPALKAKFFNFLIDHHSEWKSIRNNDPLGYLPYMEAQFERVTGYKLVGLGACTEWI